MRESLDLNRERIDYRNTATAAGMRGWLLLICAVVALWCAPVIAQEPAADEPRAAAPTADDPGPPEPTDEPSSNESAPKESAPKEAPASEPATSEPVTGALAADQEAMAARFRELKRMMLNLAEFSSATDPRRAELLRSAIAQSEEQDVTLQFQALVELLQNDQLALAERGQTTLKTDLDKLLQLLMKEDRANRIDAEKQRIQNLLKEVGRIIKEQRGVKARTEGGDDLERVAGDQEKIGVKTQQLNDELAKEIAERKAAEGKSETPEGSDSKPGEESKPPAEEGETKPKEGDGSTEKPKAGDSKEGTPKEGDEKESPAKKDEPKEGESGKPSEGQSKEGPSKEGPSKEGPSKEGQSKEGPSKEGPSKEGQSKEGAPKEGPPQQGGQPQESESQEGESGEPQQPQDENERVQKRVEAARKRMEDAQKKLKEAERKGAAEEQQQAIEELEQAKAELEKILRQLREEEVERMLALLEERFRKMLKEQIVVFEGTKRLAAIPEEERDRDAEIESGKLSRSEAQIVREADRMLTLLRDEGTAVAFPEAVGQMRDDMEQVVVRLAQNKPDELTIGLEQDIIAALEEMIESLKRAQKEQEEKKSKPQQMQEGGEQANALIDQLAELRMIRALQMRVNTRTQRYTDMIQGEQADKPDLIKALQRLAEQQKRIHQVTRDIHLGKNQ